MSAPSDRPLPGPPGEAKGPKLRPRAGHRDGHVTHSSKHPKAKKVLTGSDRVALLCSSNCSSSLQTKTGTRPTRGVVYPSNRRTPALRNKVRNRAIRLPELRVRSLYGGRLRRAPTAGCDSVLLDVRFCRPGPAAASYERRSPRYLHPTGCCRSSGSARDISLGPAPPRSARGLGG